MIERTASATKASARAMAITCIVDAPRALVFKAWTDPTQLAQWWGPRGFTVPRCELDVRPGGALRIDMKAPDGVVLPMTGVLQEVVEPERLVFAGNALKDEDGVPGLQVIHTVTFAEHEGKTKLTVKVVVIKATPEVAGALAGMDEGWSQTLDRLAAHVTNSAGR
jgi:uncharacterized protein YndB with AHSA1/START domain